MNMFKRLWKWLSLFFGKKEEYPGPDVPDVEVPDVPIDVPGPPVDPGTPPEVPPVVEEPPSLTTTYDFRCATGEVVPTIDFILANKLGANLSVLANELGKSVQIEDAYRTEVYNHLVGGLDNSPHLHCAAADVTVAGMTPAEVAAVVTRLMQEGKLELDGCATDTHAGSSYVHICVVI